MCEHFLSLWVTIIFPSFLSNQFTVTTSSILDKTLYKTVTVLHYWSQFHSAAKVRIFHWSFESVAVEKDVLFSPHHTFVCCEHRHAVGEKTPAGKRRLIP